MASPLHPLGLTFLRLTPLLSSTATLLYARDQDFFLSLLNRPDTRPHSRPLLPPYFRALFRQGIVFVVALLAVTTWGSVANLYVGRSVLVKRGAWWWYVATAVLSVGHLGFVPGVAGSIKRITEGDGRGGEEEEVEVDVNGALDEWLGVNWVRMVTVDLGAWLACCVAVGKGLTA